ncbi:MAG: hypothetical protein OEW80_11540 [Gemmatimonadota bacterium]|nr:hypothetical protein [Gemmatimonadota bacterium]
MTHETTTPLAPAEVLSRAKRFFQDRVPHNAAFPEKEGPNWLVLRGQGGEEIALATITGPAGTKVRGSTLFFDQAVARFFSTLPPAGGAA